MYVQATRMYQSTAQVLVVKKQNTLTTRDVGSNFAIIEDYVGTQVTLLKSEKVLRAAAVKIDKGQLHIPFPDDENARITYLGKEMVVTRDKEGMTGSMGSNVLNLAFRCPDARDSSYILKTIIEVYRNELVGIYESSTREQIESLNQYISDRDKETSRYQTEMFEKIGEMRKLSLE
jgi:uncharacterized protein involved in exopolysaccharide biosynthesis